MKSRRDGILTVILPDVNGGYDYMLEPKTCCQSGCTLWHTNKLFKILRMNMFNQKEKTSHNCNLGNNIYSDYVSYMHMIRWDNFINNINFWINEIKRIQDNKNAYDIHINV